MQNQKELEKRLKEDSEESDTRKSQPKPAETSIWARYSDPPNSGESFQEAMPVQPRRKRQPKKPKISELRDPVAPDKSILFSDTGALELLASVALTVPRADTKKTETNPADPQALTEWKKHSSYDRWVVERECIKTKPDHCKTLYNHYEDVRRDIYEKLRNTTPHKDAAHASP